MDKPKVFGGFVIEYRNKREEKDSILIEAENEKDARKKALEENDDITEILAIKRLYTRMILPGWVVPPPKEGDLY